METQPEQTTDDGIPKTQPQTAYLLRLYDKSQGVEDGTKHELLAIGL